GRRTDGVPDHLRGRRQTVCRDRVGDGHLLLRTVRTDSGGTAAEGEGDAVTAHALLQDLDQETAEPPLFARFRGDVVAVLGRAPRGSRTGGRVRPAQENRNRALSRRGWGQFLTRHLDRNQAKRSA